MSRREYVYVLGAGFSRGCGYPLTNELLPEARRRLGIRKRDQIDKILRFHYPRFDPSDLSTYPGTERFLTDIAVNIQLFSGSRRKTGNLEVSHLEDARADLLHVIASWFHDLFKTACQIDWLGQFVVLLRKQNAGVVSFNWDLVLDTMLFGDDLSPRSYGMTKYISNHDPVILKPHGSLNWYSKAALRNVKRENWIEIFKRKAAADSVAAFKKPRQIISFSGKRYSPLVVAPSYLKDFSKPVFEQLWRQCSEMIGQARRVVFIGYSLPEDDLQARFILRSGFYSQVDGILGVHGRLPPTGSSDVSVVNPDSSCLSRIKEIMNPGVSVDFLKERVEDWISKQS